MSFVPSRDADRALASLQVGPLGAGACVVDRVEEGGQARVTMKSGIGVRRIVDMLSGEHPGSRRASERPVRDADDSPTPLPCRHPLRAANGLGLRAAVSHSGAGPAVVCRAAYSGTSGIPEVPK